MSPSLAVSQLHDHEQFWKHLKDLAKVLHVRVKSWTLRFLSCCSLWEVQWIFLKCIYNTCSRCTSVSQYCNPCQQTCLVLIHAFYILQAKRHSISLLDPKFLQIRNPYWSYRAVSESQFETAGMSIWSDLCWQSSSKIQCQCQYYCRTLVTDWPLHTLALTGVCQFWHLHFRKRTYQLPH